MKNCEDKKKKGKKKEVYIKSARDFFFALSEKGREE